MGSRSLELSMCLKPAYVPKTISNLLEDLSRVNNESKKLSVLNDYLLEHQEELSRVKASFWSNELPQCMLLLMEAIETLKEEMTKIKIVMESAGPSRQTPLIEFLPTKSKTHEQADQREILYQNSSREANGFLIPSTQVRSPEHENKHKSPLITNQQPPNQYPVQPCKIRSSNETPSTFTPLKGCPSDNLGIMGPIEHSGLNLKTDPRTLNYHPKPLTQPIWKNKRRAWTPELHVRFVDALNLLGGIEVATPKQIKEVMQVKGLTNDQVKSHLQKYRLHYRRLPEYANSPQQTANQEEYRVPNLYFNDVLMPSISQPSL